MECSDVMPRTCSSQGTWENGMVTQGVCGAACTPGADRCSGTTPQICNGSGRWQSNAVAEGVCGAVCTPGRTQCAGTTVQTCNAAGSYQNSGIRGGQCGAACTPNDSLCAGDSGECPLLSPTCSGRSSQPNVVYKKLCDSTGQWAKQYCTTPCTMTDASGAVVEAYSCKLNFLFDAECSAGGSC
jgi:hypothetical protein